MKLSNDRIFDIESYVCKHNLAINCSDNNLIIDIFEKVIEPTIPYLPKLSKNTYTHIVQEQCLYIRTNLLRVKYLQNNKKTSGIDEGFVYAIYNPAFPDYIKIGSTLDVIERLSTYQTYSPYRDYQLVCYFFSNNRLADEKKIINLFVSKNEWCRVSQTEIKEVFKPYNSAGRNFVLKKHMYENKAAEYQMSKLRYVDSNRAAILSFLHDIHDSVFYSIIADRAEAAKAFKLAKQNDQWIEHTTRSTITAAVYTNYSFGWEAIVTTLQSGAKIVAMTMHREGPMLWDEVPSIFHCDFSNRWNSRMPISNKEHNSKIKRRLHYENVIKKRNSTKVTNLPMTKDKTPVKIFYKNR